MAFKCPFSFETPVEEAYMVYYPKKHSKVFKSSIKHIWPPVPASSKHCIFSELVDRVDDELCVGVHNFWKVGTQQWNSFLNYKQKTWDFTDLMSLKTVAMWIQVVTEPQTDNCSFLWVSRWFTIKPKCSSNALQFCSVSSRRPGHEHERLADAQVTSASKVFGVISIPEICMRRHVKSCKALWVNFRPVVLHTKEMREAEDVQMCLGDRFFFSLSPSFLSSSSFFLPHSGWGPGNIC